MRRSTFLVLHVLACRLLVPSFAATGDAQIDVPDAAWRQGPAFWAALDPTPYQVRVRVTDNRTAAKAEGQGAFRVVR